MENKMKHGEKPERSQWEKRPGPTACGGTGGRCRRPACVHRAGRHGLLATGSPLPLPFPTPYPFSWSRAGAGKISLGASGERKTEREPIGRTLGSVQRLFRGKKRERRGCADRRGSRRQKASHPCTGAVGRSPCLGHLPFSGRAGTRPCSFFFFSQCG